MQGATPIPPTLSTSQEDTFVPSWQRKYALQSQRIPQACAAIERNQRECAAVQQQGVAQSALLRPSLASGSMFAQERADAAVKENAACDAHTQDLRGQLKALEDELSKL